MLYSHNYPDSQDDFSSSALKRTCTFKYILLHLLPVQYKINFKILLQLHKTQQNLSDLFAVCNTTRSKVKVSWRSVQLSGPEIQYQNYISCQCLYEWYHFFSHGLFLLPCFSFNVFYAFYPLFIHIVSRIFLINFLKHIKFAALMKFTISLCQQLARDVLPPCGWHEYRYKRCL